MDVRVEFRKSGLEAVAIFASPTVDLDAAAESVIEDLRQAGAQTLPDRISVVTALRKGLSDPAAASGGILVAQGEPPKPGMNAQGVPLFPIRDTPLSDATDPFSTYAQNLAYPGDVIMKKFLPSDGIPGTTVLGTPIPGPRGLDVNIVAGDGVVQEEAEYRASTYGVVLFYKGRLQVLSALRISDDRMEARLTLLPDEKRDASAQRGAVLDALCELGVRQGIDESAIAEAIETMRKTRRPLPDLLVARGKAAVDGQETDYRLLLDLEKKACKVIEGDRVDFREIETVKNVRKGEILAERLPPVEPLPGYRVDGECLKPKIRRAQGLHPGEQTAMSPDGRQVLADADGMVLIRGGKFHVVESYVVPGDVDFSVGNIRASGSVQIRGQVRPGFVVEAGKTADVDEDVWEARVEAGGDVRIRGGIAAGSHVKAGRNLNARYVSNSRVEVDGDMEVSLSVAGSEIYVKGELRVAGSQGKILGGEVNATRGIEAREVGAPSSRTRVVVGTDLRVTRELESLEKDLAGIPDQLSSLHHSLGKEFLRDPKAALLALPVPLRKAKLEVLQRMQELRKREAEMRSRLEELKQRELEARDATIRVSGEIHAGTQVTVFKARTTLAETLRHVVLHYDAANNTVVWRRM